MKKKIFAALIIVTLLGVSSLILGVVTLSKQPLSVKMFDSLQEFCKLEECNIRNPIVGSDSNVTGLIVTDHYSSLVSYRGITYKVFAYVFPDVESSQSYFERVTGKSTQEIWNYSCSGNVIFRTRYIIYYENRAYLVEGKNQKNCVEFINWLSSDFSCDLLDNE